MWVRTVDGDVIAVDQIVRYAPVGGTATGRTVLIINTVHTTSDRRHHLGPFVSERQALDFARRHFGPVIDPAELADVADLAKYDPPSAVDLEGALEDSIARGREAQREIRRRKNGVAPVLRVAPCMRRPPANDRRVVAGAGPRPRHSSWSRRAAG